MASPLGRIDRALTGAPAALPAALAAVAVLGVGAADVATGAELSSAVFYVGPIALAAWYGSLGWGAAISVWAAVVWYLADPTVYSAAWIPAWNAGVRLAFFLIVTLLVRRVVVLLEVQRSLAETDVGTGLANSRRFGSAVESEIARAGRYGGSTSLVYIDLDGFKAVNDRWGHQVGDDVLGRVGRVLIDGLRATDLPARLGGDEFAVLLPQTEGPSASLVIAKLREDLEATMKERGWPVGFSMGVVTSSGDSRTAVELIRLADDLMYEVKHGGKGKTLHRGADEARGSSSRP